jgi:hypothetical protein
MRRCVDALGVALDVLLELADHRVDDLADEGHATGEA